MHRSGCVALALCALLTSACGPNAAPADLQPATPTEDRAITPVAWRLEPTPPPATPLPRPTLPAPPLPPQVRDAATAVAAASAPGVQVGSADPGAQPGPPQAPVPPTLAPPRPPLPTPTPQPPVQCPFADGTLSVPQPTYGLVPPVAASGADQLPPASSTFVSGEAVPGVSVDLRLPKSTFVAGAVFQPELIVHNTRAAEVDVAADLEPVPDGQTQPPQAWLNDPRSFPLYFRRAPGYPRVPSGQTVSLRSIVQVPFEAGQPIDLHARVGLFLLPVVPDGRSVTPTWAVADVPLHVFASSAAQELQLEVHADHQQWCVRATDVHGNTPVGPLLLGISAQARGRYMGGTQATSGAPGIWAARWGPNTFSDAEDFTASFWVGGPAYVTATVQQAVLAEP